jgi:hypothetical protein
MFRCQRKCHRFESDTLLHSLEGWMSGLNQQFAKLSVIERWLMGSNPIPSASCSCSLMVKLRAYTSAMPLDEGMIQVRILSGVPKV